MVFWKTKPSMNHTLSDIMRGMQYSVNSAQEILEKHHLQLLNKYFSEDGNPITKKIKIGENKLLDVPLISVINQNSLCIDEMEVEFSAKINAIELKNLKAEDVHDDVDRTSFTMDFTTSDRNTNQVTIKIKFKTKEQPEGISRIIDEFDKQIHPINQ
jgi:hypothetical protein